MNRDIFGKLIAISRGMHLTPPLKYERMDMFRSGEGSSLGSRQVTWWVTHQAIVQTRELAAMIREIKPEYAGASVAAIQLEIEGILRASLYGSDLFDQEKVRARVPTLFDAIAGGRVDEFARRLWAAIHSAVQGMQPLWLVLYPLRGVVGGSIDIGVDGLSVMAPNDANKWQSYSSRFPSTAHFPVAGGSPEVNPAPTVWGMKSPMADESRSFTWLICEAEGTEHDVIRTVADRMRTLLALLFAHWHSTRADFLVTKSALSEHRLSFQFAPAGNVKQNAIIPGRIGGLMPSLVFDFEISTEHVDQIKRWYTAYSGATQTLQRRATAAAQFIHHAVMTDGFEQFIHYYIALDAMFGERYAVEESIRKALLRMFPDNAMWVYRADHLFDLRNELMHGGASSLGGWKGLEAYMRHVKTSPLEDVGRAAMTAFRSYFTNPPQVGAT